MADGILFNPDNRQLGNSTGDFSLYGGQSEWSDGLRAPDLSASTPAIEDQGGAALPTDLITVQAPSAPQFSADAPEPVSYGSGGFAPATLITMPSSAALLAPAVPHAIEGSGAPIPIAWSGPQPVRAPIENLPETASPETGPASGAPAESAAAAAPSGAGDAIVIPITALAEGTGAALPVAPVLSAVPLVPIVEASLNTVDATLDTLGEVTAGIVDSAGATLETVVDTTADLTEATLETLTGVTAEVVETAGATLDAVVGTTANLTEAALETVGDVTGSLAGAVPAIAESTAATVGGLASTTGSTVEAVVGGVTDTLSDLAGSDPEAGVATLVSLVSTADALDLQPLDVPLLDTVADTGLDLVDALAADDGLVGSLLGGSDHGDGGLFGHDSDHPLGLL